MQQGHKSLTSPTINVIFLKTDLLVAGNVERPHERFFVLGMSETEGMAELVGENVGETSALAAT